MRFKTFMHLQEGNVIFSKAAMGGMFYACKYQWAWAIRRSEGEDRQFDD
jgi:hypothetical protein